MFFTALAVTAISLGAWAGENKTVSVDADASSVAWEGKKVSGAHDGYVKISEGSLMFDGNVLTGGSFVIDMTSINVADISDPKMNAKLEGHLKSPDFFAIEEFTTASFVITNVAPQGDQYKITGTMVIKNIAQEISFLANVEVNDGTISATADMKIDRAKFNVRYGSDSFFDNLGDKVIHDEFDLSVNLVANL